MIITIESQEIRSKFQEALKSGDYREVDVIPIAELREAKNVLIGDLGSPYHDLLLDKIRERESPTMHSSLRVPTGGSSFATNKSIFVAHRFEEMKLIAKLKRCVKQKGYEWQEGKREDLGGISADILAKIQACGFFIAVMTRKDELKDGTFTTSSWLIEEKGAALAFGHRPLIMVEECIDRHYVGFLQSDDEMIYFNRANFTSKAKEAVAKIDNTYRSFCSEDKIDCEDVLKAFRGIRTLREEDIIAKLDDAHAMLLRNGIDTRLKLAALVSSGNVLDTLGRLYMEELGRPVSCPLDPIAIATWGAYMWLHGVNEESVAHVRRFLRQSPEFRQRR